MAVQALCSRVHAELDQRRHDGDAAYFGDVYGYEAPAVRFVRTVFVSLDDRIVGSDGISSSSCQVRLVGACVNVRCMVQSAHIFFARHRR